jgi:hypothetical protein
MQSLPPLSSNPSGHDHNYCVHEGVAPHGALLVKSGTDFRELSVVTVELPDATSNGGAGTGSSSGGGQQHSGQERAGAQQQQQQQQQQRRERDVGNRRRPLRMAVRRVEVVASMPEDPETAAAVVEYAALMGNRMDTVIGATAVDLDGRFTTVGGRRGRRSLRQLFRSRLPQLRPAARRGRSVCALRLCHCAVWRPRPCSGAAPSYTSPRPPQTAPPCLPLPGRCGGGRATLQISLRTCCGARAAPRSRCSTAAHSGGEGAQPAAGLAGVAACLARGRAGCGLGVLASGRSLSGARAGALWPHHTWQLRSAAVGVRAPSLAGGRHPPPPACRRRARSRRAPLPAAPTPSTQRGRSSCETYSTSCPCSTRP